uniref:Uncharacterized protein n=1 Tax=Peronospora matthiolae TaxID=2874970 RepID=A0AAV1VHN1_9STRA
MRISLRTASRRNHARSPHCTIHSQPPTHPPEPLVCISSAFYSQSPAPFFGESAESIASGNPVTASRSDDTTSNSPIRLQSQGSPVGMTASTTHRSVGSKDWIAPSSNHKGERTEERAMGMDALVKLYNYVNDLKLNQDTYLYRKLEEWFKRPVHPTDVAENLRPC